MTWGRSYFMWLQHHKVQFPMTVFVKDSLNLLSGTAIVQTTVTLEKRTLVPWLCIGKLYRWYSGLDMIFFCIKHVFYMKLWHISPSNETGNILSLTDCEQIDHLFIHTSRVSRTLRVPREEWWAFDGLCSQLILLPRERECQLISCRVSTVCSLSMSQ